MVVRVAPARRQLREALPGHMVREADGEWRLARDRWRLPLSYTLQAVKQPGRDLPQERLQLVS